MRNFIQTVFLVFSIFTLSCGPTIRNLDTPPPPGAQAGVVNEIDPQDALPRVQAAYSQFVDVRTAQEYAGGHAVRARNIPLDELPAKLDRLERQEPVYIICQSGRRSKEASEILLKNGYKWVFNVTGGTSAWQAAGLPMEGQQP